jgi:hypothetical protein
MSRRVRVRVTLLVVATAATGVAAGCNFVVGVGDYAANPSNSEGTSSDDSGEDADALGTPTDATLDAASDVQIGSDAASDVQTNGNADAGAEASASCSPTAISGCALGTYGYACTGSDRPQQESDASLACTLAPDGGPSGTTAYCCITSTCSSLNDAGSGLIDPCYETGWTLYGCSGQDTPQQASSVPLACQVTTGGCYGATDYCCGPPSCTPNAALSCAGQTGYTCTGDDTPSQSNSALGCSQVSTNSDGATNYCCGPITCTVDYTVEGCSGAGLTGYACSGSDTPWDDFSSVGACSATSVGDVPSSAGYCCSPSCNTDEDCEDWPGTVCDFYSCTAPSGLVGDPCSSVAGTWAACSASDAGTATCNGDWCTQSCTSDDSCGTNTDGNQNYCVASGEGGSVCAPSCNQNSDCAAYNAGFNAFCTTIETGVSVCLRSGGKIGDPCSSDNDCKMGTCAEGLVCSQACASASDTSCGSNSQGNLNQCAQTFLTTTGYGCYPGCQTSTDCTPYTPAACSANPSTCNGSYCTAP